MFPQLFHFGQFFLPTYGFLVSLGVLIGLWISVRNSERMGIDGDKAWNFGILVVLCGIVGAKVLYVINEWGYYSAHPREIFSITTLQAGGVFSGGLTGGFRGRGLVRAQTSYARSRHLRRFRAWPCAWARHRPTGMLRGRMLLRQANASFLGRDVSQSAGESITGTPLNVPLEPTQLFEAAVELANFFFLMWLLKRRKFDGQVFGAFLFIYGMARFFLEFLRDDPGRGSVFGGAMSGTQLIAIGLVIGGGLIWWLRPGMKKDIAAQPAAATR